MSAAPQWGLVGCVDTVDGMKFIGLIPSYVWQMLFYGGHFVGALQWIVSSSSGLFER